MDRLLTGRIKLVSPFNKLVDNVEHYLLVGVTTVLLTTAMNLGPQEYKHERKEAKLLMPINQNIIETLKSSSDKISVI